MLWGFPQDLPFYPICRSCQVEDRIGAESELHPSFYDLFHECWKVVLSSKVLAFVVDRHACGNSIFLGTIFLLLFCLISLCLPVLSFDPLGFGWPTWFSHDEYITVPHQYETKSHGLWEPITLNDSCVQMRLRTLLDIHRTSSRQHTKEKREGRGVSEEHSCVIWNGGWGTMILALLQ